MNLEDEPTAAALRAALTLDQYPRAAAYEPRWALENLMGSNVLWLTEALSQAMDLPPGQRVLDLGCGRVLSSMFLASEFAVQVWQRRANSIRSAQARGSRAWAERGKAVPISRLY